MALESWLIHSTCERIFLCEGERNDVKIDKFNVDGALKSLIPADMASFHLLPIDSFPSIVHNLAYHF